MTWPLFFRKATQTVRIGLRPWGDMANNRGIYAQAKYGHLAGAWATTPMGPGFPEGTGCNQPVLCLHPGLPLCLCGPRVLY